MINAITIKLSALTCTCIEAKFKMIAAGNVTFKIILDKIEPSAFERTFNCLRKYPKKIMANKPASFNTMFPIPTKTLPLQKFEKSEPTGRFAFCD